MSHKRHGKINPAVNDNCIIVAPDTYIIVIVPDTRKDMPRCKTAKSDKEELLKARIAMAEELVPIKANNSDNGADGFIIKR